MKIYRIRDKSTKLFFDGLEVNNKKIIWNSNGTTYKQLKTISLWIRTLSCDKSEIRKIEHDTMIGFTSVRKVFKRVKHTFDKRKLNNYEIVCNDLSVNTEEIFEFSDIKVRM